MTMSRFLPLQRSLPLLLSLALNLLFVSALALHVVHDMTIEDGDRGRTIVERMAGRLPASDAMKLRAAYAPRSKELAAMQTDVDALRDRYRAELRAKPFDKAALERTLDQLVAKRADMFRAFGGVIVDAAANMSPEGRAALAERHRRR